MPAHDDNYLNELRASVRVSEIVAKKYKLIEPDGGSGYEFCVDNETYSIDDESNTWSNGTASGDQFGFWEEFFGYSFDQAVDAVAKLVPKKANGNGQHGNEAAKLLADRDGILGYMLPSAARTVDGAKPENKLKVFKLQARELLGYVKKGIVEKIEIVDALHEIAENNGLIELNGEDEIQQIMALAVEDPQAPAPFQPRYRPLAWGDEAAADLSDYAWLIKGIVPAKQFTLIAGPKQRGKSFKTLDIAAHIFAAPHFDNRYMGYRTVQAGVVWCAYEAAEGINKRVLALRNHYRITSEAPFVALREPPNLFHGDETATKLLVEEIKAVTASWTGPWKLGAIVIDTHNAATRGSSEIKSDDIGKVLSRYDMIRSSLGCALIVIGHTNAAGNHRGNEQLINSAEAYLEVGAPPGRRGDPDPVDYVGRPIRSARVVYQREGEDRTNWQFVIKKVELGRDYAGDPVTSCVIAEPERPPGEEDDRHNVAEARAAADPAGTLKVFPVEAEFFKSMLDAIKNGGIVDPPDEVKDAMGRCRGDPVVMWSQVKEVYQLNNPVHDDTKEERTRRNGSIRTNMHRAAKSLKSCGAIGAAKIGSETGDKSPVHYVWPTGRPVRGRGLVYPKPQISLVVSNPIEIDEATGKPIEDVW
jgi:hypothetical protein